MLNDMKNSVIFDEDYIALLNIANTALQVYNIQQSNSQTYQNNQICERLSKIESKLDKLEKLLERSTYHDR